MDSSASITMKPWADAVQIAVSLSLPGTRFLPAACPQSTLATELGRNWSANPRLDGNQNPNHQSGLGGVPVVSYAAVRSFAVELLLLGVAAAVGRRSGALRVHRRPSSAPGSPCALVGCAALLRVILLFDAAPPGQGTGTCLNIWPDSLRA